MKTALQFVLATLITLQAQAQIILEHTYPDMGYFGNFGQLLMVDLEADGMSYVAIEPSTSEIRFYDLEHILYKTISYASAPVFGPSTRYIMYISEHLFDLDDEVEFLYCTSAPPNYVTQVINEDGTVLLNAPGAFPFVVATEHNQHYPVYNTVNGAKLILSHDDGTARVYSLTGTLTTAISEATSSAVAQARRSALAFPNPVQRTLTILPDSSLRDTGMMKIIDARGATVVTRTYPAGSTQLSIDVEGMAPGMYRYALVVEGTTLHSGVFVKAE